MLAPAGYAASFRYSAPDPMVTGHTVYVQFFDRLPRPDTDGRPTDFAAVAGYFSIEPRSVAWQRECVLWFNGKNVDHRPGSANHSGQAFPSDEDEPYTPGGGAGSGDRTHQDYDFDRDVDSCIPESRTRPVQRFGTYAVVVEKGDCDPRHGKDFQFRAHLDFVDPNSLYHEVQEYSYVCPTGGPAGLPNPAFLGDPRAPFPDAVIDLFPDVLPPHEPQNKDCADRVTPTTTNVSNGDYQDMTHWAGCQSFVQSMFTERLWITPVHNPAWDPTLQQEYTFALQIDTCDGSGCNDGSRDSFDDTSRGSVMHSESPHAPGDEAIMRGNSYDFDPNSPSADQHRQNCRHSRIDWRTSSTKPGPNGDDCYPENHKTAQIDIYMFDHDPTRLFAANSNGMNGPNAYVPSPVSGPYWFP